MNEKKNKLIKKISSMTILHICWNNLYLMQAALYSEVWSPLFCSKLHH